MHRDIVKVQILFFDHLQKFFQEEGACSKSRSANGNRRSGATYTANKALVHRHVFFYATHRIPRLVCHKEHGHIRLVKALTEPTVYPFHAVTLYDMLGVLITDFFPNLGRFRGGSIPHFALITRLAFCCAGFTAAFPCDTIGHTTVGKHQIVSLFRQIIHTQIAEREIKAQLTVAIKRHDIFKHSINTDGMACFIRCNLIQNAFSPIVFYRVRGMKKTSVPKILLFFNHFVRNLNHTCYSLFPLDRF